MAKELERMPHITALLREMSPMQIEHLILEAGAEQFVALRAPMVEQIGQLLTWAEKEQCLKTLPQSVEKVRQATFVPKRVFVVPSRRNQYFTGREEVLKKLHDALTTNHKAAISQAIQGLGGVGKTQTALEYCYQHQKDYAYILWTGASDTTTLDSSYRYLAERLNLGVTAESKPEEVYNLMQRWFAGNEGWLLILDNADTPELVVPYLPKTDTGRVLITSRDNELDCLGVTTAQELKVMSPGEALAFLLERTGRTKTITEEERRAAERLGEALGYLPLALEQAGAYLKTTKASFALYLTNFEQKKLELLERSKPKVGAVKRPGDEHVQTVAVTWDISIQKVRAESAEAEELLKVCAFLSSEDIPEEVFTEGGEHLGSVLAPLLATVQEDILSFYETLAVATRYALLEWDEKAKMLSMHRLLQEVVRTRLSEAHQRDYAERCVEAVNAITPEVKFEEWAICRRLLPVQRACYQNIVSWNIETESATSLLNRMALFVDKQGRYGEAEPLYQKALDILRQIFPKGHPHIALILNNLAELYQSQGRYEEIEPLYQEALDILHQGTPPENLGVSTILHNLAALYYRQGHYKRAESFFQEALRLRRQTLPAGHLHIAESLNGLAEIYYRQGHYKKAEPLFQEALHISRQALSPEDPNIAHILNMLAMFYLNQRRYKQAEPFAQEALDLRRRGLPLGHHYIAQSLNTLASLYDRQGRPEEAESLFLEGLDILRQALPPEHPHIAASLNNLALLYYHHGRCKEAEPYYQEALAIWEKTLGIAHPNTATCYGNLAALYQKMGDKAKAREYTQKEQMARQAHEERNRQS